MHSIDACSDVRLYFHERLNEAFESQRTSASQETEAYLLNLLAGQTAAGSAALECPLVLLLERAHFATGIERVARFQQLGDAALMVYGFFSDLMPRRGIDESYVRAMGGTGYATASSLIHVVGPNRRLGSPEVFRELSERFSELGAVVADVRDQTSLSEREVVAVYERWVKTRSPRLARRLAKRGLFPDASRKTDSN